MTAILLMTIFMTPMAVNAQSSDVQNNVDILPVANAQSNGYQYDNTSHTHPALKLTPDKSELVRLDKPAGSIIIGNPNHLNILADTSKTLVLVPRLPGATHFTVLGKDGNVLMQRHVIVASPKEKYMRIRRSCAGSDNNECRQTSVFYCPDMCHEVIIDDTSQSNTENGFTSEDIQNASNNNNIDPNANGSPVDPNDER